MRISYYNLKYSFTPITIIFISILFLILTIFLVVNTGIFESQSDKLTLGYQRVDLYLKNSYFITNLVTSVLVIGLPVLSNKAFEYSTHQIYNRNKIFIAKVLSGLALVFFVTFITLCYFIFIPSVCINLFYIDKEMIMYFVRLFLQLIMLYFVLNVIYDLTENPFSVAFLSIIYFIVLVNNFNYIEINSFMKIMQAIFPIILYNGSVTHYLNGEIFVLVYNIAIVVLFRYIYLKKDMII